MQAFSTCVTDWLHNIDKALLVLSNQIWMMALSVCFIFTVTIGVFPAVTVDVKSTVAGESAWGESAGPFHTKSYCYSNQ